MKFKWERISNNTYRAQVVGGWLVNDIVIQTTRTPEFWSTATRKAVGNALCFVPDPKHLWNIGSDKESES